MGRPAQSAGDPHAFYDLHEKDELEVFGVIERIRPAHPSARYRRPTNASLGFLSLLPAEILFLALDFLDFQSLSRLSRVSIRTKETVEEMPAYTEMMEHAPRVLTALAKTGLIRYHSAPLLYQVRRSGKCSSCFSFGAFLFLPTCERVCFECLHSNIAFRVAPANMVKKCFTFTNIQLKKIPFMYSIPGMYRSETPVSRRTIFRLVSIKHATALAVELYGSISSIPKPK